MNSSLRITTDGFDEDSVDMTIHLSPQEIGEMIAVELERLSRLYHLRPYVTDASGGLPGEVYPL